MTTLVNLRTYGLDKSNLVYIDRRSMFGNPFPLISDYSREKAILQYRIWFYRQLELRPDFVKAVRALKGKTLACWCVPLPCHGDVIIEYLEGL